MTEIWTEVGIALSAATLAAAAVIIALKYWPPRGAKRGSHAQQGPSEELQRRIERVRSIQQETEETRKEAEENRANLEQRLLEIAGMSREDARAELTAQMKESSEEYLEELRHDLLDVPEAQVEARARAVLLAAMQRVGSTPMSEETSTTVSLPNDDMKGRLIGREGRNIRSFESVTGVSLLIDETPDTVLLSGFDPVRREIARVTLEALIKDGRIHPASIEEKHQEALAEMDKAVISLGEEAIRKLRLSSIHPEIVSLLGKLHFRHSFSQNTLDHSIEVAFLCSLLASEIGFDPVLAKRAGLFHDLGKAISHEFEGSHASAAAKILRHHGEPPEVINAVAASHEEVAAESPYAGLVMLADSISAARPGARADSTEGYIQRVRSLENLARGFEGVKDCYALQAGREIRAIVDPENVPDDQAKRLALQIRHRIENELQYPSTIKVTVIRESRFCETAK
ncbi:ribonuclease Y [Puniceicoccus vermicola]|uniref:Ribonuclease Y n=1 Tax=Puniceicoccus vermicola TaxID=388746 RepID=A0A7X1E7W7_9BACT|nr:ribonuclease Y [Puniceicoccus vermicola]MBC2604177.1 ribonuclease Y [Puniceicoccus vermicola]